MENTLITEDALTREIIGAAIEVHRHWGPGLLEEVYEKSLCKELELRNLSFERQLSIPLVYKGEEVGDSLRIDILVAAQVIIELKAVKDLEPVHEAQLLTYMKLTDTKIGLLINFNVPVLKQGIRRMVL